MIFVNIIIICRSMGAGYGLSNNWGYNNYTSYLGYGGAGVGVSPYQASGLPTYSAQVKFSMKKQKHKHTHNTIETNSYDMAILDHAPHSRLV